LGDAAADVGALPMRRAADDRRAGPLGHGDAIQDRSRRGEPLQVSGPGGVAFQS